MNAVCDSLHPLTVFPGIRPRRTWLWAMAMLPTSALATGCTRTQPIFSSSGDRSAYPAHWWQQIPRAEAASWEVLPQDAGHGQVVLSKRNELGLLSNFAHTPFTFRGRTYQSLEGFWQMMKYPESPADPRASHPGVVWKFTRDDVSQMTGFEAKSAGTDASHNMEIMNINWVTFEGRQMAYRTSERGEHYRLVVAATREKICQNAMVRNVLLSTGDLYLVPDHHQPPDAPPAWRYHEIAMQIREELAAINARGRQVKWQGHPASRCPVPPGS